MPLPLKRLPPLRHKKNPVLFRIAQTPDFLVGSLFFCVLWQMSRLLMSEQNDCLQKLEFLDVMLHVVEIGKTHVVAKL